MGPPVGLPPPLPPPADVIVEKVELFPEIESVEVVGCPVPPPPTVIGKVV